MAQPRSSIHVTHFVPFYDRRLQERLEMHGVDYHTAAAVAAAQELSACEKVQDLSILAYILNIL